MLDDKKTIDEALSDFYRMHRFEPGRKSWTIGVYVGCMLVPLPNVETRYRYIKQHDLHHLLTGYGVGRIGEGEVSAWELGTGSMRRPMLGFMNLVALSTGLFLSKERIFAAYLRGRHDRNLYRQDVSRNLANGNLKTIGDARALCLGVRPERGIGKWARIQFAFYAAAAMIIHGGLVIPAIGLRLVTDTLLGMKWFPKIVTQAQVKTAMQASRQG